MNYQPQEACSRLSKTLDHVLRDSVAIPHFMHFTELRGADHMVRFWLESESFRSTSWSRVRAHSLNSVKQSSLAEPISSSNEGSELHNPAQCPPNDVLTVQPEQRNPSSTEAGLSPGTPRAETSCNQVSSRTGTPYKIQSNNTLRDLSDKLMKSESCFWFVSFTLIEILQVLTQHW